MADVTIYTRQFCPFCTRAVKLLKNKGVEYAHIDAGANVQAKAEMVERSGGARTFPQIFVNNTHIGGCDDLMALDQKGELDRILFADT